MSNNSRPFVLSYLAMIEDFLAGNLPAGDLMRIYQESFLADPADFDEREEAVINEFFLDLEDFVDDPTLRRAEDFDEAELRRRAGRARGEIRALLDASDGGGKS